MSLLDQPPLDLAEARARLAELRRLIRRRAALGFTLALLGVTLTLFGADRVGIPLLIGAAAAVLLVGLGRDDRRRLLIRLVAQDDAWSIDEVRRAATRLVSPTERRRLAGALRRAAEAAVPRHAEFSVVDHFRAVRVDERLRRLAARVADDAIPLRAPGAALYNPNLAEADLDRALARIESAVG